MVFTSCRMVGSTVTWKSQASVFVATESVEATTSKPVIRYSEVAGKFQLMVMVLVFTRAGPPVLPPLVEVFCVASVSMRL